MSADPLLRLPPAFGAVLIRRRKEKNLTADVLAISAGLSAAEIESMERGEHGLSLMDFFRLAGALGEEPTFLLIDLITAWRVDRSFLPARCRPSDFERLFRLGYDSGDGNFRELSSTYWSVAQATDAAAKMNPQRHLRGVEMVDMVTIYVRLHSLYLRPSGGVVTP